MLSDPYQSRYNLLTLSAKHGYDLRGFNVNMDTMHLNYQCETIGHNLIGFNVNRDTST